MINDSYNWIFHKKIAWVLDKSRKIRLGQEREQKSLNNKFKSIMWDEFIQINLLHSRRHFRQM